MRALAAGLHAAGVGPGDRVANVTETNRPEWNFIDLAVLQLGAVHVPIYPTLTAEEFQFILDDSGAKLVFVSSEALRAKMAGVAGPTARARRTSITTNPPRRTRPRARRAGPTCASSANAAARETRHRRGARRPRRRRAARRPRHAHLHQRHHGPTQGCHALARQPREQLPGHRPAHGRQPDERAISFLPLCHIFERTLTNAYLYSGMSVYYAESLERVGENMREVHPDFFAIVPRILEKIFERIIARGNELTGRRRQLFFWALDLAERIDPENPSPLRMPTACGSRRRTSSFFPSGARRSAGRSTASCAGRRRSTRDWPASSGTRACACTRATVRRRPRRSSRATTARTASTASAPSVR